MRDMAERHRPRERLMQVGERAVSTAELLAIILRTGVGGRECSATSRAITYHF